MNKTVTIIAFILLLFASFASAAMYNLGDFSKKPQQGITISKGDSLQFELLNGTHYLRYKELSTDNKTVKINLYPFKGAAQQIPYFTADRLIYVDLDKDGIDDLLLDIYSIEDNGDITLILSKTIIEDTNVSPPTDVPEGQGLVVTSVHKSYSNTILVIGLIIVVLGGILLYRKAMLTKSSKIEEEKPKESS